MDRVGLIGSTDSCDDSFLRRRRSSAGTRRRVPTNRVVVLTCFGRGGDHLADDRLLTRCDHAQREWHAGVFGERKALRKGLVLAFRSFGIKSAEPLRRHALEKTLEMKRPTDGTTKNDPGSLVVKLMDYHIVFADMIDHSFERATFINLTQHPYGQCESLMRSGLSVERA